MFYGKLKRESFSGEGPGRGRAEAERGGDKPIKRQSVAPVDAGPKKAAARCATPAQPQRRGFSFSSWQT